MPPAMQAVTRAKERLVISTFTAARPAYPHKGNPSGGWQFVVPSPFLSMLQAKHAEGGLSLEVRPPSHPRCPAVEYCRTKMKYFGMKME
jgi:hypothetical protein